MFSRQELSKNAGTTTDNLKGLQAPCRMAKIMRQRQRGVAGEEVEMGTTRVIGSMWIFTRLQEVAEKARRSCSCKLGESAWSGVVDSIQLGTVAKPVE